MNGLKAFWSKFGNGKIDKEDILVFAFLGAIVASVFKFSVSTRK